jgi:hypothetical protein
MELQLEDYWKVVRPRRAKPVGGPSIPLKLLDPLVEWFGNLSLESRSFQVLLGERRDSHLRYLQSKYPFKVVVRTVTDPDTDLVETLLQVLQKRKISENRYDSLDFAPPSPLEWDFIWCLVAIPHMVISSNLLDIARKDKHLIELYKALEELRFEALEKRVMISIEEGIQRLVLVSLGSRRRDRLNSLLFLSNMAYENGLLDPFPLYLETKDNTSGLLELLHGFEAWESYGSPLKLLIGCEEHTKYIPMLHKYLADGMGWMSPR